MLRPSRKTHHNEAQTDQHLPLSNKQDDEYDSKKKPLPVSIPVLAMIFMAVSLIGISEYISFKRDDTIDKGKAQKNMSIKADSIPIIDAETTKLGKTPKKRLLQEPPLLDEDGTKLHLVFSTDCSAYQHWQSYLLFYTALKVGQPGYVTRIASGCKDDEKAATMEWHKDHIQTPMSGRFRVHFTPHFSSVKDEKGKETGRDYKFFNKPFGLRHWLENGEGMGLDPDTSKIVDEDVVVILTDPDMILLRPIGADFSNKKDNLAREFPDPKLFERKKRVEHGSPFSQRYGLGTQWERFNLDKITGDVNSPAKAVNQTNGFRHFPAGPPYIATARDMHQIAVKWTEFAPLVNQEYPHLLGEMFAYCIAAAHLKLPHQLISSLMVSNTNVPAMGEGWKFVDDLPSDQLCDLASHPNHKEHPIPNVVHYCQPMSLGDYFWNKRPMPKNFFTCASPLLVEPPRDLGPKYTYKMKPFGKNRGTKEEVAPRQAKRIAFLICATVAGMNDAAMFYKKNHCEGVGSTNYEYTLNLKH